MEDVLTSGSSNPNGDIYWTKIDELKKWKENSVYEPTSKKNFNKMDCNRKIRKERKENKSNTCSQRIWGIKQ